MIIEVLEKIKKECENDNSECVKCPFNIHDTWHEYCVFLGQVSHEGATPDEWEIEKIKSEV